MHKLGGYGSWAADTYHEDVSFNNFKQNFTRCGAPQNVFTLNKYGSDFLPQQYFEGVKFNSVNENALTYMFDPPEKWNNLKDCIGFPCTAPHNTYFNFF